MESAREKWNFTYRGRAIWVTVNFWSETRKPKGSDIHFQELKEKSYQPRILYLVEICFRNQREHFAMVDVFDIMIVLWLIILGTLVKIHWIIYFKWANFTLCKWYLNADQNHKGCKSQHNSYNWWWTQSFWGSAYVVKCMADT